MWGELGTATAGGLTQGLGNAIGGGSAPAPPQSFLGAPSYVNVQPVGVNLGAILQPFTQGAPANGGSGLDRVSRFLNGMSVSDGNVTLKGGGDTSTDWFFVGTAVVIALAVIVIKKRRRG